jgi:pilus assembly protein FimV
VDFDLSSLSLDLDAPSPSLSTAPTPAENEDDPLATKLALADEFKAIGDTDGARALIEEIIAEADGEMKSRAEQALAALG